MTRNVDKPILDLDGKTQLTDASGPITIKSIVAGTLSTSFEGSPSGIEKLERYRLALKVYAGGDVELSVEELSLIKTLVNAACNWPIIVGQVFEWCDE